MFVYQASFHFGSFVQVGPVSCVHMITLCRQLWGIVCAALRSRCWLQPLSRSSTPGSGLPGPQTVHWSCLPNNTVACLREDWPQPLQLRRISAAADAFKCCRKYRTPSVRGLRTHTVYAQNQIIPQQPNFSASKKHWSLMDYLKYWYNNPVLII